MPSCKTYEILMADFLIRQWVMYTHGARATMTFPWCDPNPDFHCQSSLGVVDTLSACRRGFLFLGNP
jgi:hypothetical protein